MHGFTNSFGAQGLDFLDMKVDKNGVPVWAYKIGGKGNELWNTVASYGEGFIFTGISNSFTDKYSWVMCNVRDDGKLKWSKLISSNSNQNINYGVIVADGEGDSLSTFTQVSGNKKYTPGICAFDKNGQEVWVKTFDFNGQSSVLPGLYPGENDVFLSGMLWSDSNSQHKGVFLGLDVDGKIDFAKYYKSTKSQNLNFTTAL